MKRMGVAITELLEGKEIEIEDLKGKTFAVDAFNMLYQFLTTIRMAGRNAAARQQGQRDEPLDRTHSHARRRSWRKGSSFVFVFDGEPPELKREERERRKAIKQERSSLQKAEEKEDIEEMKKYAGRTATLNREMVQEAKGLIEAWDSRSSRPRPRAKRRQHTCARKEWSTQSSRRTLIRSSLARRES